MVDDWNSTYGVPQTPVNVTRANAAIPPILPTDIEQPNSYQNVEKPSTNNIVSESELGRLTGLLNNPLINQQATNQGNLLDQKREFEQKMSARRRRFEHVPNALDKYHNYTYHIRWSLADDIAGAAVKNRKDFQNVRKVIIAESGVTAGFNITEFELENLCAPSAKNKTTMHVGFKMTIKEPYGFSLIDRVYSASKEMGVKNHLTNTSFIELWFTGYNEDGSIATPELNSSLYKLFRVIITEMNSDTTSEGTTYHLEGLFSNMYATTDSIMISPSLSIGPVQTVGSFFIGLQLELNRQQESLEYDFNKRVEYKFNVPSWLAAWEFSQSPTVSTRNSDMSVKRTDGLPGVVISISRGMDINTILYNVISMTKQGQEFIAGENRSPNQPVSKKAGLNSNNSITANGMANLIMIHSNSTIIGFDYLTNDYVRRITYSFREYPTARAMIDAKNVQATQQPAQQTDKENVLIKSGRYKKIYEYIYTGKNIDILKFDIKLEWFWQSPIPTQLGDNVYSNYTAPPQLDSGGVAVNVLNQYRDARTRLAKAKIEKEKLVKSIAGLTQSEKRAFEESSGISTQEQIAVSDQAIRSAEQEVASFGQSARRFQVLWDSQSPGTQVSLAVDNNDRNFFLGDQSLLNNQAIARTIANQVRWRSAKKDLYLEDINSYIATPLPISFRTSPEPMSQATTTMGDGTKPEKFSNNNGVTDLPIGRSLVSTVLNDVTATHYFAEVDLEIRGDPYWIGVGNIEEDNIIDNNAIYTEPSEAAWFYNGECGFYITFRTGEAPNEQTGFMEFNSGSIAFTGLYNVHTVTSTFSNGRFTQRLEAIKDTLYLPPTATTNNSKQNS